MDQSTSCRRPRHFLIVAGIHVPEFLTLPTFRVSTSASSARGVASARNSRISQACLSATIVPPPNKIATDVSRSPLTSTPFARHRGLRSAPCLFTSLLAPRLIPHPASASVLLYLERFHQHPQMVHSSGRHACRSLRHVVSGQRSIQEENNPRPSLPSTPSAYQSMRSPGWPASLYLPPSLTLCQDHLITSASASAR